MSVLLKLIFSCLNMNALDMARAGRRSNASCRWEAGAGMGSAGVPESGGVSPGQCGPMGNGHTGTATCEQTDRHTRLKRLPSRNFRWRAVKIWLSHCLELNSSSSTSPAGSVFSYSHPSSHQIVWIAVVFAATNTDGLFVTVTFIL